MRLLLTAFLMTILAACGAARQPAATAQPAPTVPAVAELLQGSAAGPVKTIGYLYSSPQGALLADSLSFDERGQAGPPSQAIWVESPPELPPDTPSSQAGDARYTLVEARGQLEGPGQFGPGGVYPYQLVAPVLEALSVRELTMPLLLQNSALYEGQPVRLQGQLLARADSALLVERLGAGGVPADTALQLKLAAPPRDPSLATRLRSAGAGDVRFGPVEITGLWRGGRLYPLAVLVR